MATRYYNRITILVLSLLVLACVGIMPRTTFAQMYPLENLPSLDAFGDFVVGPGKQELEINPGESKTIEITVANRMGMDKEFSITVEDMKGSEDPEQTVVLLGSERGPYSIRDYFSFPERVFLVPHAKKARVPVTITIPEDAEPGGYYGSVLFETTTAKTEDKNVGGAAIVSRIGVLFFVTIPGKGEYNGTLETFKVASEKKFFAEGPIPFQLLFRNKGNMHVNPSGSIRITNMIGTPVETLEVEPWFALPGSLRLREVEWNRAALAGRYTATAEIHRGYGNEVDVKTITFWVIPTKPVLLAVLAVFVLFFLVRFIATRFELKRK